MSDEIIKCAECGREFVWSYGEQRFYKERGYVAPKRCKACRSRRAAERDPGMRGFTPAISQPRRTTPPRVQRARRRTSWWANPNYRFGLVTFGLGMILALSIHQVFRPLDVVMAWLIAINLVACLAYRYDKLIAGSTRTRVPENVLLFLALIGGTIGAWVGMRLFHHKTAKTSFRLKFWPLVVIQIALIAAYYVWIRPRL